MKGCIWCLCYILLISSCGLIEHLDYILETRNIKGKIVNAHDGKPVANAEVRIMGYNVEFFEKTYSNSDGEYSVGRVECGMDVRCMIDVKKDGYFPYDGYIDIPCDNGPVIYDVKLSPYESPNVSTLSVSDVTSKGACFRGRVEFDGGLPIIECGFYVGRTRQDSFKVIADSDFTCVIDNMDSGTKYGYSAFASNGIFEGEGEWLTFETLP